MSKEEAAYQSQVVNWAYEVIDAYNDAFNQIISAKSKREVEQLTSKLFQDGIAHSGALTEAFMILSQKEHEGIVYSFWCNVAKVLAVWSIAAET